MDLPVEMPLGACDTHVVPFEVNTLPLVLGATACSADVPLPSKTLFNVRVVEPVPPLAAPSVPASVIAPVVAVDGVKPLSDVWNDNTGAEVAFDANNFTVPAAFLKYSFSSVILIANSPLTRLPAEGTAAAVVL